MFANSKSKDLDWQLIAVLDGPEGNIAWNKRTGALPIYKAAESDPFYKGDQFKGWFNELSDKDVVPLVMPTYVPGFAYFADCGGRENEPAGAARPDHARGHEQAMGRHPDEGQAEGHGQALREASPAPPPPRFAWSPSPASRGRTHPTRRVSSPVRGRGTVRSTVEGAAGTGLMAKP